MTLSNQELTHKVNNLTETLGYVQEQLQTLTVEQRRRLGRVEKRLDRVDSRLDGHDRRFDEVDRRLDEIGGRLDEHTGLLQEVLRRLPESA